MDEDYIGNELLIAELNRILLSLNYFDISARPVNGINPANVKAFFETSSEAIQNVLASDVSIDSSKLKELSRFSDIIHQRMENCSSLLVNVFELQQKVVTFYMTTFSSMENQTLRLTLLAAIARDGARARASLDLFIVDGDHHHISNAVYSLGKMIDYMIEVLQSEGLNLDEILELRDTYDELYVSAALAGAH